MKKNLKSDRKISCDIWGKIDVRHTALEPFRFSEIRNQKLGGGGGTTGQAYEVGRCGLTRNKEGCKRKCVRLNDLFLLGLNGIKLCVTNNPTFLFGNTYQSTPFLVQIDPIVDDLCRRQVGVTGKNKARRNAAFKGPMKYFGGGNEGDSGDGYPLPKVHRLRNILTSNFLFQVHVVQDQKAASGAVYDQ